MEKFKIRSLNIFETGYNITKFLVRGTRGHEQIMKMPGHKHFKSLKFWSDGKSELLYFNFYKN